MKFDAKAYSQVSYIINEMSESLRSKIPEDVIELIEKNRDSNYIITGKVADMQLLKDTEKILSCLYTDYIATEEEKKVIKNKEKLVYWEQEQERKNGFKN